MNDPEELFLLPITVGVIFIILGVIMVKFPPKKINSIYGYRLPSSMKSQERWDFAQVYSSKQLIYCGIVLTIISFVLDSISLHETTSVSLGIGFVICSIAIVIYNTEKAIKRKFA